MEGVAWFTHKYVMHGFLWNLHEDHHFPKHVDRKSFFEKNDWFFVIFAFPSMVGYIIGSLYGSNLALSIAIGITLYGIAYFVFHEVVFHRRLKWLKNWKSTYVRSIILAHSIHHQHYSIENGECFGLLIFPFKYYKIEKKRSKNNVKLF
jgi:beta-carotene 3-hydroxylase